MRKLITLGSIGILTGLINGLLGIGGGTILIPAMVFILGVKQHQAHGTSLMVIWPTAALSSIVYYFQGHLDLVLSFKVALGAIIGGYLGAKLMNKISASTLKKIFGAFMILAGLRMVF